MKDQPKETPFQLLRKRYPVDQYALMQEVSDAAGFSRSRSADFIIMSLWPSRGLYIHGIELKSFRGDWLNEKKNPRKAENIFQHCDYFSLLTTEESIAKLDEIPEAWGWMNIIGGRIKVMKDAPKNKEAKISNHFVAAMLKRASDRSKYVHVDDIQEKIDAARADGKDAKEYDHRELIKRFDEVKDTIDKFEAASGIRIHDGRWKTRDPKKLGDALRFIMDGGSDELLNELIRMKNHSDVINRRINEGIDALKLGNEKIFSQHEIDA